MPLRSCLLAIMLLSPSAGLAQATATAGFAALIRGDYATAARILRPHADDARHPDPVAAFFLATLYHTGRGVAMNYDRACALYLKAARPGSPVERQALALAEMIHRNHPIVRENCFAASQNRWNEPPPASFTLAPGHEVRVGPAGFLVEYNGVQAIAHMTLGGARHEYLPIRYTTVNVSRPVDRRRHFIEFFMWIPRTHPAAPRWHLWWSVYEVVGDDTLVVPVEHVLATADTERPPMSAAIDDVASVRANTEGEAEWVVFGPDARSGIIPDDGLMSIRRSIEPAASSPFAVVSSAAEQTSTLAGLEAFRHGDYERAAELLKPVAESWPSRDHVAELLMAVLYEEGRGVAVDAMRACALYSRLPVDAASPLAWQAQMLMARVQERLTNQENEICVLLGSIGLNHGFEPVTFVLGPGHWISIDLNSASITYDGRETRIPHGFAMPGVVFLPIEHTELIVGRTELTRRHFVEVFLWLPGQEPHTWTLFWHLFEVVREQLIAIRSDELAVVSGDRPPPTSALDVRSVVRISVNDDGEAEWQVLGGRYRGSGVIAPALP